MENKSNFPKYLSIQTTAMCNAACIFCPYDEVKSLFPSKVMEERLYQKIIDECGSHTNVERVILYMNNEPLTDPHLIQRINDAKEKIPWASVHILTNGSLLTEELADQLIHSKVDWVGVSMHGIRKQTLQDAMGIDPDLTLKRVRNFFNKAKEHRNFKDFAMITFLGHDCLTPEEKDETLKFWRGEGIERISYFEQPISRAGNVRGLPAAAHERIAGCKSIWADEMMHIVETGEVVSCCMDWKRETVLGDLNGRSIEETWCSEKYEGFREKRDGRRDSASDFICKRCEEAMVFQEGSKVSPEAVPLNVAQQTLSVVPGDEPVNIALVMVPPWQTKMPPLGLAYLSSFLRAQGVATRVIDLNVTFFNAATLEKKYLWDIASINDYTPAQLGERFCSEFAPGIEKFIEAMVRSKEEIFGFSTTIASINVAIHIAHQVKRRAPSKIMILGGSGVFFDAQAIDPGRVIDVFVIGEGELPLLEILRRFQKNRQLSDLIGIPGTIVRMGTEYHSFQKPNPVRDLDQIPLVDFSGFDLNAYSPDATYRPLPVLISRGCINRCSFCVDHKMNFPFRSRTPRRILEELSYYVRELGRSDFEFNDLLCNGDLKQLEDLCDLILEEKLKIRWHSYAAIRLGMTGTLLKKMKDAGCFRLCYGMESASDVVLKKMNKPFDARVGEQVLRATHQAGISTAINIIIGHPGESEKEFEQTCDFLKRNKDFIGEITNVSTCFLMLKADLVEDLGKYGIYFKKTFKEWIRAFLTKEASPCPYRKFHSRPDNSPRRRARRLRKMLALIHKLKIPNVIVNRVTEDDAGFNEFIRDKTVSQKNVIRQGALRVEIDPRWITAHLYFKDQRLTSDVGMNTSFLINGTWIDSSKAGCEIKKGKNKLSIKLSLQKAAISQHWTIKLHARSLSWDIRTRFHEDMIVTQQKTGMIFSDQYDRYTTNGTCVNFPGTGSEWNDVAFLVAKQAQLIPRVSLPTLILDQTGWRRKEACIQFQNLPASFSARMINFCLCDPGLSHESASAGRFFRKNETFTERLKIVLRQK